MSAYDNVVGGKLKLKGKALDVKSGGVKKKKKQKKQYDEVSEIKGDEKLEGLLSNYCLSIMFVSLICLIALNSASRLSVSKTLSLQCTLFSEHGAS